MPGSECWIRVGNLTATASCESTTTSTDLDNCRCLNAQCERRRDSVCDDSRRALQRSGRLEQRGNLYA